MFAEIRQLNRVTALTMGLALTTTATLGGCASGRTSPASTSPSGAVVRSERALMGSPFSIAVWVPSGQQPEAAQAINDVLARIASLEQRISSWDPDSETSLLNDRAGGTPVRVSEDLRGLIALSLHWSDKTGGAFDVTGAPLFDLYEEARRTGDFPSDAALQRGRGRVGAKNVVVRDQHVALAVPGMRLSFGGIGKGYAADMAASLLRERGFENYLIDAGGDLLIRGARGDERWEMAVRHPRKAAHLAYCSITDCAMATSGDYERYFVADGKRYSHIVDPRTGRPVMGPVSVTVLAPRCADADAIATAVSVLGKTEGLALVESIPGAEAVLIGADGTTTLSSGLRIENERLQWKR